MTSQASLSKVLAIAWKTDKPFQYRDRVSPDFCFRENTWYLKMESDVIFRDFKDPFYSISLIEREIKNPNYFFSVLTGVVVKNEMGSAFHCSDYLSTVSANRQKNIWRKDMKLISSIQNYPTYAEVMVVCVFKDVAPSTCRIKSETNDLSTQTDIEWPLTSLLPPALLRDEKRGESSKDVTCEMDDLSADFSHLLEQQHFADLKLTCEGRSFSVHRSILVARSQFFAQKFQAKPVENESPPVDIPDVDFDILELLLKFVYSGKIPCLDDESAPLLWAAGRTYAVHGLQKACLEWMVRNLSQQNCVDFLAISEEFDDDVYKNTVVSFIVSHPDVLKSEKWKKFSKEHSKLAIEVYENFVSSVFDKINPAD